MSHHTSIQHLEDGAKDRIEHKRFLRFESEGIVNIENVSTKEPTLRSEEELVFMQSYLKFRVPFFKTFEKQVLELLTKKLKGIWFNNGDIVMRKDEIGDCMYCLIKGEVAVFIDTEMNNCIVTLKENKVFGERALEHDDKRTASIVAKQKSLCLKLDKNDFLEVIFHVKML